MFQEIEKAEYHPKIKVDSDYRKLSWTWHAAFGSSREHQEWQNIAEKLQQQQKQQRMIERRLRRQCTDVLNNNSNFPQISIPDGGVQHKSFQPCRNSMNDIYAVCNYVNQHSKGYKKIWDITVKLSKIMMIGQKRISRQLP